MRKIVLLVILIASFLFGFSQTKKITGKVTDENGIPVIGASVIIKGTSIGTVSATDGSFTINAKSENETLILSALNMKDQEVSLKRAESGSLTVTMYAKESSMDEVVVVAYGKATKQSVTGAVSQITAKDIEKRALTTSTGVLEGASPGIMVNNTYGQPGSTPSIRIRGFTSINGVNTPLTVVDGVIYAGSVADIDANDIESISVLKDAAAASLYGNRASNGVILITTKRGKAGRTTTNFIVNQGIYNRGIKDYKRMNPDEFMETMWLGYRNNLLSKQPNVYTSTDLANAQATKTLISNYIKYNIYNQPDDALFDANGKLVPDAEIKSGYLSDLDWYSPILQNGYRQNYTVNGSAGSNKSNLYYSGSYLDEKGFMQRSRFKRFTGRVNGDIAIRPWMQTGFSLNGSHRATNNYSDGNTSYVNPIYYARNMAPVYPVHLHDMTTGDYLLDANGDKQYDDGSLYGRPQNLGRHSIWENQLDMDRLYGNTLQGQAFAEARFLKDFTFTVKGDLNTINTEEQTYNNAIIGDGKGNGGRASREAYRYNIYTFQQQLNWNRSFNRHSFDVLAGHENYNYYYSYLYGYKTTETFAGQTDLINFTNITSLTDYQNTYRTESYLSRLRYNFDQKYYAEFSFRRDGSSRFYSDNRWGNFWSASGSWIISRENFMKGLEQKISDLKFRASYGEVGNDQSAGMYAYMALYSMNQNANVAAIYKSQNEAKSLIWETSANWGAALEGRLFKLVNFSAEYFDKRSQNLLFDVNLPLSAGATSSSSAVATITKNIGVMSNRGWEFAVDADIVNKGNFSWNLGLNATLLKTKIIRLPEENRENGIIDGTKKYMEGHGRYDYWLYQYAGVDQMTGNALYIPDDIVYNGGDPSVKDKDAIPTDQVVQINGKYYTLNPSYAKRDWSGSAIPNIIGGINTSLRWKGLTLSALFTYSLGSKIIDYNYQSLMTMSGSVSQMHQDLLNAWNGVPAGMTETSANRIDPNGIPVVDFSKSAYSNATSDRFLQDGSYFVIKNIGLNYRLPASLIKRIDLNQCSLNFTIENLATFTKLQGMDPQQSFDGTNYNYFMTPRVFSLGINIGL